jgi:NADPH-dependent 2,4-dienoyl-CoA reductase/sulfur reductase-like enzyme
MSQFCDVAVIGGGPAGLSAAIGAREAGAEKVLVLERDDRLGGILPQCVHPGFGSIIYGKDMPGPSFAARLEREFAASGAEARLGTSVLDLTPGRALYASSSESGFQEIEAGAIVLAMGCRERTRAQIGVSGQRPAGIYTAGEAQRMINIEGWMPGKRFVILGSGDIGMIMARRLVIEGAEVAKVVEALPYLTGLRRNYVQCLEDFGIPLELSTTVARVIGKDRLRGVVTERLGPEGKPVPGSDEQIECDALLLSVGLIPENELSRKAGIALDPATGGPAVDEQGMCSVPGFFSAGNVRLVYDLVDHACASARRAGAAAAAYAARGHGSVPSAPDQMRVSLVADPSIRMLSPARASIEGLAQAPLRIELRVARPMDEPLRIEIAGPSGTPLAFKRFPYARPAEMLVADLDLSAHAATGLMPETLFVKAVAARGGSNA